MCDITDGQARSTDNKDVSIISAKVSARDQQNCPPAAWDIFEVATVAVTCLAVTGCVSVLGAQGREPRWPPPPWQGRCPCPYLADGAWVSLPP